MGNCQAVDAAALVIQHPNGKLERMYCPILASDVMKTNPGHYVSLIIPLPNSYNESNYTDDNTTTTKTTVRFSRVKLMRATDTLVLGRAYRLVTTQEVMKVIRAKKHAKLLKKNQSTSSSSTSTSETELANENINNDQGIKRADHKHGQRSAGSTSKSWRPSLISISESGS